MAAESEAGGCEPLGRVQFEVEPDSQTLAVHVDRPGFRRRLLTLERLAASGDDQTFERSGERSGRGRRRGEGDARIRLAITQLHFHIDSN